MMIKRWDPYRAHNSNKKFTIAHDSFVKDVRTTEISMLELTDHQLVDLNCGPSFEPLLADLN
jgi:hypothetical protein